MIRPTARYRRDTEQPWEERKIIQMCLRGANLEERLVLASLYIYIPSFGPQKNPKTRNTTTAAKSIRVLPILKQVPRIESAPKNACLATCDRQIANSTSDQINNIIKTKTKKIKQRPSPPQPSSSPPPPPPSRQPTSATWPTAPPSPSLHT